MKSNEVLAERYAAALMETAREQGSGSEERICRDLRLVDECISVEPSLFRQLSVPSFDRRKKNVVLETTFEKAVAPLTIKFLQMLVRRNRFSLLRSVYPALRHLRDKELKVRKLLVTGASELSPLQRERIEHRLRRRFGENCTFTYRTDDRLIGGFTVTSDGIEVDCSIRAGLCELKKELSAIR